MITLCQLKNTHRPVKKVQRVGRGPGSKRGKTSCRGHKGDKARSGYQRNYGREGGQLPLYRKLPVRGFANGRFRSHSLAVNLSMIEILFKEGELVTLETLQEKGFGRGRVTGGLKVLGDGELKKKVKIEAHAFSKEAQRKLESQSIPFTILSSVQQ